MSIAKIFSNPFPKVGIFLFLAVGFLSFLSGCEKKTPVPDQTPWPAIVKDLKVIQDLRVADSTKRRYLEQTLHRYGISTPEYQQFVKEMKKKSAAEDIQFLKSVERLLLKEMKAEAKKQVPKVPKSPPPKR